MDIKTVASFIAVPFRFLGKRWGIIPLHTETPQAIREEISLFELLEGSGDPTLHHSTELESVIRLAQSVELYVTGEPGSFALNTGTYVDDFTKHTTRQNLGLFASFKRISEESDPIASSRTIVIAGCKTAAQDSPMEYFQAVETIQGTSRTIVISWRPVLHMEWCVMRTLYKNVQTKTPGRNTIGTLNTVYDPMPPAITSTPTVKPTEIFLSFQHCVSQRHA